MDISQLNYTKAADKGYEFVFKMPDGTDNPDGSTITVIGDYSDTVRNYEKDKLIDIAQKREDLKAKGEEFKVDRVALDEVIEQQIQDASIRVIDIKGFTSDGKEYKYSKKNVEKLLRQSDWLCAQIMEESSKLENFTPEK